MKLFAYYITHTFVNSFKKLFRTWVAVLFAFILLFGIIGGIAGVILAEVADSGESTEIVQESEPVAEEGMSEAQARQLRHEITELAIGGLSFLLIIIFICTGDKSGANIFKMPDVNFLFTAPIKPQSVLMFRTVMQMGIAFISAIYLLGQTANLINAGFSGGQVALLFITYAIIIFIGHLASVCTYTVAATHIKIRKYIRPAAICTVAAAAGGVFLFAKLRGIGIYSAAVTLLTGKATRIVPIFGWLRGFVLFAMEGRPLMSIACLAAILVTCGIIMLAVWHIKVDFYEDALERAQKTEEALAAARDGKRTKREKDRAEKINRNRDFKKEGALIFFEKSLYNRRRFSKLGLFTNTGITYITIAAAVGLLLTKLLDFPHFAVYGAVMSIAVYLRNLGNPAAAETETHFLYTVPQSPYKKIMFITLGSVYETAADLLPAVIIAAVLLKANIFTVLLWYLLLITLDLFCTMSGIFIEIIIPSAVVPAIKALLQQMLRFMAIIPGIALLGIGFALSHATAAVIVTSVFNTAAAAVLFAVAPGFLHLGKK